MALFKKKGVGIADVIRCDEPSYLIWKWHPAGARLGESGRENAIRWGTSLRVKEGEVAVFVYNGAGGSSTPSATVTASASVGRHSEGVQEFIVGPYDDKLKTANLPIISGIVGMAYHGDTPFQAEVYFINLARIIQTKFAVPFFDICDPRFPDFGVPVAVRGTITFQIDDYRRFIKLHRLAQFDLEDFQRQIKDVVCRYVKNAVAGAPVLHGISVIQIESKLAAITAVVEDELALRLREDFGVSASGADIGAIEIDRGSEGYARLCEVTRDATAATVLARTQADIEHYRESLRIQREEDQYAQRKQTQSANLSAFGIEKQAEVGIAGANALGQMGANGSGGVDLGAGGFHPAAMMAGMALGGAVGQNLAGVMSGAMSGGTPSVTPPIPVLVFFVADGGVATGPFDLTVLRQMVAAGRLDATTLVWRDGMAAWSPAGSVPELRSILTVPPIPPA